MPPQDATAASITWALMAAFLKATTNLLAASGLVGTLEHWPVYALLAAGVLGSVLQQAALQVGPLSVSQPLIVVVDPAVSEPNPVGVDKGPGPFQG